LSQKELRNLSKKMQRWNRRWRRRKKYGGGSSSG